MKNEKVVKKVVNDFKYSSEECDISGVFKVITWNIIFYIVIILFCLFLCFDWDNAFTEKRNYDGLTEYMDMENYKPIEITRDTQKINPRLKPTKVSMKYLTDRR